jgi:hypothetical protein
MTNNNLTIFPTKHQLANRNGSKDREDTPCSSRSSTHSQAKLDLDANPLGTTSASGSVRRSLNVNNVSSTASSAEDEESLTLLEDSAASVTIPSPLSPIAGPLLMTHRFTYANNKKRPAAVKQPRAIDFFRCDYY